jgi:hypothetical protein
VVVVVVVVEAATMTTTPAFHSDWLRYLAPLRHPTSRGRTAAP